MEGYNNTIESNRIFHLYGEKWADTTVPIYV